MIRIIQNDSPFKYDFPIHEKIHDTIIKSSHLDCFFTPWTTNECLYVILGKTDPNPNFWQSLFRVQPEGCRKILGKFRKSEIKDNFVPFYITTERFMPEAQQAMEWLKSQLPELDIKISLTQREGGSNRVSAFPPVYDSGW